MSSDILQKAALKRRSKLLTKAGEGLWIGLLARDIGSEWADRKSEKFNVRTHV